MYRPGCWLVFKPQPQEDNSLSFGQLRDINPDVCGWLTLDGTAIDYPVVQGESNFTYLNTDVYGSFALAGSIFLDVDCDADFSGRYSLLYGHHMENGRMFGDLDKYKDGAFFRQNTTGTLTLPGGSYRLEVLACLVVPASEQAILPRASGARTQAGCSLCGGECPSDGCTGPPCAGRGAGRSAVPGDGYLLGGVHRRADGGAGPDGTNVRPAKRKGGELIMRRLPKMAAALLAAALAVALPCQLWPQTSRAELELERRPSAAPEKQRTRR
ncbi:MAG: class B sortase [Faecalibacterium prausnitzii]